MDSVGAMGSMDSLNSMNAMDSMGAMDSMDSMDVRTALRRRSDRFGILFGLGERNHVKFPFP